MCTLMSIPRICTYARAHACSSRHSVRRSISSPSPPSCFPHRPAAQGRGCASQRLPSPCLTWTEAAVEQPPSTELSSWEASSWAEPACDRFQRRARHLPDNRSRRQHIPGDRTSVPTTSNSITFSHPPVVHNLDLILCNTFSIMKYSGNSIGE